MVTRLRNQAISATISMIFIALVVIDGVLCQQAPTADRRTAQNPNGKISRSFKRVQIKYNKTCPGAIFSFPWRIQSKQG